MIQGRGFPSDGELAGILKLFQRSEGDFETWKRICPRIAFLEDSAPFPGGLPRMGLEGPIFGEFSLISGGFLYSSIYFDDRLEFDPFSGTPFVIPWDFSCWRSSRGLCFCKIPAISSQFC